MATPDASLSVTELAAARNLLASVNGLQDALSQLEYLQRLPLLIRYAEERKTDVDAAVQMAEQKLSTTMTQVSVQQQTMERHQAEVTRLEAEITKLQAYLASEHVRLDQLRLAKEVLKDELRADLSQ
jgi:peptidoglycan hydrolase CwlO-like protein